MHNMPDVLVFSGLVPKLLRAKVILDLHDPMPELMMTIFGIKERSWAVRILKALEKLSLAFADAILTVNEACRKIFSRRSCAKGKVTVVMNSPDEEIFAFREQSMKAGESTLERPFVLMYHGSIVERHGLDVAVAAFAAAYEAMPGAELHIYGKSTPFLEEVLQDVEKRNLSKAIRYLGPKKLEEIAAAIRESDVGVIPNRRSIFTELNTPTRIFEYLSQAKPVIAPRAPGILDYFDESSLLMFELGNVEDLTAKYRYAFAHKTELAEMVKRAQKVYQDHQWSTERLRFLNLTARLLGVNGSSPTVPSNQPASRAGIAQ
ncbi:MAG: glycosyltransferase [Verrucomicrobia bacterium]|nr:glycosyltransferase [Verrucomicrobiota bacterium]